MGAWPSPSCSSWSRASIAAVVPSRWHENQPLTVLEAFGAAVPVVATDLGGLPELVRDGLDGLVVPSERPAALAAALDSLVQDPERALTMGRTARARVLADFSTQTHLERLGEAYDEATRHRASGSGRASGARRLVGVVGR